MKRDDDPQLWDLLGRAAEPKVSPFFARNIIREIREADSWRTLRGWLEPRRLIPLAGLAAVVIAVSLSLFHTPVGPLAEPRSDTLVIIEAIDYEIIADLDDLLASDDNNSFDETALL